MTHAVRIVAAVAVLMALVVCVPVQAQTPEIDAQRALAEQGDAAAQCNLGFMYADGLGVSEDYVQAHMWLNIAASRATGELRENAVNNRDLTADEMTPDALNEAQRLAREWDAARPR